MSNFSDTLAAFAGFLAAFGISLPVLAPAPTDLAVPLPPPPVVIVDPSYTAKSILIADLSGDWRTAERSTSTELPIASITKIMTGFIALELMPPSTPIVLSAEAIATPGEVGDFREGEVLSLQDALHAVMMSSSNDVAMAIAETVGGRLGGQTFDEKISRFVDRMNEQARAIGMNHTHYRNPTGLDQAPGTPSNISTADDLLVLVRETQKEPLLWETSRDINRTIFSFGQDPHTLFNLNGLASVIVNFIGSKTGTTDTAGESIVIMYETALGNPQVLILLGAEPGHRMFEASSLLEQAGGMLP